MAVVLMHSASVIARALLVEAPPSGATRGGVRTVGPCSLLRTA